MTMHRSGIVWLLSTFAFCSTVALILATGPAQNSISQNVQAQEEAVQLPQIGAAQVSPSSGNANPGNADPGNANPVDAARSLQPPANTPPANSQIARADRRGRAVPSNAEPTALSQAQPVVGLSYQPKEIVRLAHPSNYGERFSRDANGNPTNNDYIVVLHETVGSATSALNTFQNNHVRDEDQVSYHTLIDLDGTIYYVVPPEQRAFGAGNSAFQSFLGEETVFTNPDFPSSVNNFAYHISLETPIDGQNSNATYHSGYTEAQYQSLAWLLARTNIPDDRITTHRMVDRSGSRIDPRSFEADRLFRLLRQYPSRQKAG